MTRGIKLSRKQSRALRHKLKTSTMCAIMVISMGVNSITVIAQPLPECSAVQKEQFTQESLGEMQGTSMLLASNEQEAIDVSSFTLVGDERIYTISENGTYTFKGSNYQLQQKMRTHMMAVG